MAQQSTRDQILNKKSQPQNSNGGGGGGLLDGGFLLSLIQLLAGTSMSSQSKDWKTYQGWDPSKTYSMNTMADNALVSLGTTIAGPIGGLVGSLISQLIVPGDFNKLGGIDSSATMLMRTGGGTYGGSFQNMLYASTTHHLKKQRDVSERQLNKLFYRRYLQLTQKGQVTDQQVNQLDNQTFSVPAVVNAILDPVNQGRILKAMSNAQAGGMLWQSRKNPFDVGAAYKRAKQYSKAAQDAAIKAQLVTDKTDEQDRYGGFSGAAAAQLVGILANASQSFNYTDDIDSAVKALDSKVKEMTKAMYPLRDIFGQDMKAMVDALQAISGVSIAQLSPSNIARLATEITDASKYSGLAPSTIHALGGNISKLVAANKGSNLQQLGARSMGAFAAFQLAPGNQVWGMSLQAYQASTQNTIASIAGSEGADLVAMAYGLHKGTSKKPMSVSQFNAKILASGKPVTQAAMELVGAKSAGDLYRGRQYGGYSEYILSGAGAQLGTKGLWDQELRNFVGRAMNRKNVDYTAAQVSEAYKVLKGMSSEELSRFAFNPQEFIKRQREKGVVLPKNFEKIVLADTQSGGKLVQSAKMYSQTQRKVAYQKATAEVRQMFQDVETGSPSTGYQTFYDMLTKGSWKQTPQGYIDIGNNKKVTRATLMTVTGQLLGDDVKDLKTARQRFQRLRSYFGQDTAKILQFAYMGGGKDNKKLHEAIQRVASKDREWDVNTRSWKDSADVDYVLRQAAIGGNTPTEKMMKSYDSLYGKDGKLDQKKVQQAIQKKEFTQQQLYSIQNAQSIYNEAVKKAGSTEQSRKKARQDFRKTTMAVNVARQVRLRGTQLFGQGNQDLQKFRKATAYAVSNPNKSDEQIAKHAGMTLSRYQSMQKTIENNISGSYDERAQLMSVLREILNFLRKLNSQGGTNG